MKLLWPHATAWWNAETVADILESMMGIEYLCAHDDGLEPPIFFPHAFVHFLHDWCYAVYRYHRETAWQHDNIDRLRSLMMVLEVD